MEPLNSGRSRLQKLCAQPRIYIADDFATSAEIDHILAVAGDPAQLARLGIAPQHNKAGLAFEWPVAGDTILGGLTRRTYDLLGMQNALGDSLRFRRYQPGEYHPAHSDVFQVGRMWLVLTALLYLTDTDAGGETYFPRAQPAPVTVAPRGGRLAIWFNHLPNGEPDPAALHEALAVQRGEKATLGNFVYQLQSFAAAEL